jgi:hypothetical protein
MSSAEFTRTGRCDHTPVVALIRVPQADNTTRGGRRTDRKETLVASYAGTRATPVADDTSAGAGWVTFASIMLLVAGTWNLIDGILAIGTSRVYAGHQTFVFSDLNTWGWIVAVLGALQLLAAFSVMSGNAFGRWFGIGAASLNAIGQLMFIPAYPLWGLSMFTLDILIIYGLAAYGGVKLQME